VEQNDVVGGGVLVARLSNEDVDNVGGDNQDREGEERKQDG